ncbi:hypothetical protein TrVGV298_005261 [Trichoderma virens]|nr:hypothetical protein TrVGV298_005261 [Trichoderma virens]
MATTSQPPADAAQTATPMETDEAPDPTSHHQDSHPDASNDAQSAAQPAQPVVAGPRAARLQELYAQSLRRTLGKLKWDNFAACYPTVASKAEPVLKQVQAQMVEKLGEKCEKEFESILATRQVVLKLNDLETLISEATHRRISAPPDAPKPTPPHLLPAREILSAHLAPSLAPPPVPAQRTASDRTVPQRHTAAVGDVKSANAALEPVVQQLAREARDAEKTVSEEE